MKRVLSLILTAAMLVAFAVPAATAAGPPPAVLLYIDTAPDTPLNPGDTFTVELYIENRTPNPVSAVRNLGVNFDPDVLEWALPNPAEPYERSLNTPFEQFLFPAVVGFNVPNFEPPDTIQPDGARLNFVFEMPSHTPFNGAMLRLHFRVKAGVPAGHTSVNLTHAPFLCSKPITVMCPECVIPVFALGGTVTITHNPAEFFTLAGGNGDTALYSRQVAAGTVASISSPSMGPPGRIFSHWQVTPSWVQLANRASPQTTLVMPAHDVAVSPVWLTVLPTPTPTPIPIDPVTISLRPAPGTPAELAPGNTFTMELYLDNPKNTSIAAISHLDVLFDSDVLEWSLHEGRSNGMPLFRGPLVGAGNSLNLITPDQVFDNAESSPCGSYNARLNYDTAGGFIGSGVLALLDFKVKSTAPAGRSEAALSLGLLSSLAGGFARVVPYSLVNGSLDVSGPELPSGDVTLSLLPAGTGMYGPGSRFAVELYLDNPAGVSVASISYLDFKFDADVLEWDMSGDYVPFVNMPFAAGDISTGARLSAILPDMIFADARANAFGDYNARFSFDSSTNFIGSGVLMRFNLRVKRGVQPGSSALSLSLSGMRGLNGGIVTYGLVPGSVILSPPNYGDVNGDGRIDSTDVLMLRRFIGATDKAGFMALVPSFNRDNADVNGDGVIDAADATQLRRWIAAVDKSRVRLGPAR
jgi:hypothetical protein